MKRNPISLIYKHNQKIFIVLNILLVVSFVFWPLLNSLLIIFTSFFWLMFMKKDRQRFNSNFPLILIFAFPYLLLVVGWFYSANTDAASRLLQLAAPMLVFPMIFGTVVIDFEKFQTSILRAFSKAVSIGCLFCVSRGLWIYFQTGSPEYLSGYSLVGLKQTSPYIIGLSCVLAIWIEAKLSPKKGSAWKRPILMINILTVAILSGFILLLSNRIVIMLWSITVCSLLYSTIINKKVRYLLLAGSVALVTITLLFVPATRSQWNELLQRSERNDIKLDVDSSLGRAWGGRAIRVAIWKCSRDLLNQHWLVGVGTGDVQDSLQQAYENRKFYFASMYNRYNAHNQYIQSMLTGGVFSALALIVSLVYPIYFFWRRPGSGLYTVFLLCVMVIFFTESMLETNKGIIYFSYLNSIFAFSLKHLVLNSTNPKD